MTRTIYSIVYYVISYLCLVAFNTRLDAVPESTIIELVIPWRPYIFTDVLQNVALRNFYELTQRNGYIIQACIYVSVSSTD